MPVAVASTGRPRRYCSDRCKQKAARNRRILTDVLTTIGMIRLDIEAEPLAATIDWSDEEHRVA